MKIPTAKEIEQEIKKLKNLAPLIRQRDLFGGSNRAKIEADIEVLRDDIEQDEIDQRQDDGDWDSDTASSAQEARAWLDGDAEDGAPSESWKHLLPKD